MFSFLIFNTNITNPNMPNVIANEAIITAGIIGLKNKSIANKIAIIATYFNPKLRHNVKSCSLVEFVFVDFFLLIWATKNANVETNKSKLIKIMSLFILYSFFFVLYFIFILFQKSIVNLLDSISKRNFFMKHLIWSTIS